MIYAIIAAIVLIDQLTKFLARSNLGFGQSIPIIKNIFHFTLVYNRGAAFGILKDRVFFFVFISLITVGVVYVLLRRLPKQKLSFYVIALCFILAGGVGNLIDRLAFGYVIDFFDFRIWPVFNVADSSITVGAILLGWQIINPKIKDQKSKLQTKI